MPKRTASVVAAIVCVATLAAATPATAVINGSPSSLSYVVRVVGRGHCSGVTIAPKAVATAAHCAGRGARVYAGGNAIPVVAVTRSIILDDGRRVRASGDAAILRLASPLLVSSVAPVGGGYGNSFTIAGYGTTDERVRGAFGSLNEARLVAARSGMLIDPHRRGGIGASACFGDSGGPVLRGGVLVGIITRASYPGKRIACGYYTRWSPISATSQAHTASR